MNSSYVLRMARTARMATAARMPRISRMAAAALLLVALGLGLSSCSRKEEVADPPRLVRTYEVRAEQNYESRTFVGRTRAGSESRVSPKVAGAVQQVLVDIGDEVAVNDVIARIDPEPLELQRQAAASRLAGAQAQEVQARAAYSRVSDLYRQELASRSEYDAARAAIDTASASVDGARRQLELAELQLSYTEVRSPFDGRVSARIVQDGENVAAGHPIVMITSRDRLEIQLSVPDTVVSQINRGDEVSVRLEALGNTQLRAVVSGVGGGAALGVGTFPVTLQMLDEDPRLRAGMIAEVTFTRPSNGRVTESSESSEPTEPVFRVPASAVAEDREGRFVFRLRPLNGDEEAAASDGAVSQGASPTSAAANGGEKLMRVERSPVEIGKLHSREIELRSGVQDGDLIITLGLNHISDEMTVRVMER
ncbi:MAG: efflux RND transporter periplasmic adaptor subunit [Spirochaetaceae bacterium]|nr:MAG: efflux RND transporter periplasmic adaptor subunit [Spirochaetaceae bacterium]